MDTIEIGRLTGTSYNTTMHDLGLLSASTTNWDTYSYRCKHSLFNDEIYILVEDYFIDLFKKKIESDSFQTMLASERVLSKDWNSPEEDEAWLDL